MKNIKVYNRKNELISDFNRYENEYDFINFMISNNYFGQPERWILKDSEQYNEEDILKTEERLLETGVINQDADGSFTPEKIIQIWVLIKADYRFEVEDLDNNYDWLLSEVHKKRKAEYPPVEDYLDAIVKNDEDQKNDYIQKCLEVKRKYPLPTKEI